MYYVSVYEFVIGILMFNMSVCLYYLLCHVMSVCSTVYHANVFVYIFSLKCHKSYVIYYISFWQCRWLASEPARCLL